MLFQPALGAFLGLTGGSPVNPLMGSSFLFSNTARSGWWVSASMTRALLPSERVYMKPGLSAGSGGGQVRRSPSSSLVRLVGITVPWLSAMKSAGLGV